MKAVHDALLKSINESEKKLLNNSNISGMSLFNIKKANYLLISKNDFDAVIEKLKNNERD